MPYSSSAGSSYINSLLAGNDQADSRMRKRRDAIGSMLAEPLPVTTAAPAVLGNNNASVTGGTKTVYSKYGGGKVTLATVRSGNQTWQVDARAAKDYQGFLNKLNSMGYKTNSSGGFADRAIRGSTKASKHATGDAIDINAARNPMGSKLVTDMPKNISAIARMFNLKWGGDFKKRKDAMHFEWMG